MKTYLNILSYCKKYSLWIVISLIASIFFALFNAISIWMVSSLIGTIMNDPESNINKDIVCVFHEKTPYNLVKFINPNILFKGSDYSANDVVGRKVIQKNKGKIVIIKKLRNYSTTKIINKFMLK